MICHCSPDDCQWTYCLFILFSIREKNHCLSTSGLKKNFALPTKVLNEIVFIRIYLFSCWIPLTKVDKSVGKVSPGDDESDKKEKPLDSPQDQESTTDSSEQPKSKEEEQDELKVRRRGKRGESMAGCKGQDVAHGVCF